MWKLIGPALVAFGLIYLHFLLLLGVSDGPVGAAAMLSRTQFALKAAGQVAGILVALAAAVILLRKANTGESADSLLTPRMGLLGGILLFETHWTIVVSFAALAVVQAAERVIGSRRGGPPISSA